MLNKYLKKVIAGEYLESTEAYDMARMLLNGNISLVKAGAILGAMRTRKESVEEIRGFVEAIYDQAVTLDSDVELIDTCGTGGDGLGTFNISTLSALITASCGIPVAKHGNQAVTSKVGSADVLMALGVNVRLTPDEARRLLDRVGITFLFAPYYHPILKEVAGLRREIGAATIFNLLGPLLNPFPLTYQVVGIADSIMQEVVGKVILQQGHRKAMIINAENGMDEISPNCKTRVYFIESGITGYYIIDPQELGIEACPLEQIKGGDEKENARLIIDVLKGKTGPCRDTGILNAAAAIFTAGKARDLEEGMLIASEAIDSGRTKKTLEQMISYSQDGVIPC
ncbi:MAG: anthranilate phosphoribosyltransferase [Syntrophomonadaceae bacterium]|nr:anthranilate phosphoribosyltransferase [Syntrophomonadaceae bacterium]MDD3889532.1 anthranilate phosphoribosyltransferase [Syntrophomonadaceae bacterium]MDD4549895.1 anthranilate phosphoribosyltransferase [Syntrophomonadaceae bacterium]